MAEAPQRLMKAVHACRRQVPALADDAAWRGFLVKAAGKASLRDMNGRELGRVMDALHENGAPRLAGAAAAGPGRPATLLDSRPQARMVRGIWIEMAKAGVVRDSSERALDAFAKRVTGLDSLRFCDARQLNLVVEAVKDMRDRAAAPPPGPATQEAPPHVGPIAAEIVTFWNRLCQGGAMRTGIHANLETWLLQRGYGQRHPEYLTPDQAAHAHAALTGWWKRHQRRAPQGDKP